MKLSKRQWEELLDSVKVVRGGSGIAAVGTVLTNKLLAAFVAATIWVALTSLILLWLARQIDNAARETSRRRHSERRT